MTVQEILEKIDKLECGPGDDLQSHFNELAVLHDDLEEAIKAEHHKASKSVAERIYEAQYGEF